MSQVSVTPATFHAAFRARESGAVSDALAIYDALLQRAPDNLEAAIGRARCLFYLEQWQSAWRALDVRLRLMPQPPSAHRTLADGSKVEYPRWRGGPVPRRLLVLDEQGLGDTIHFSRFLPQLVDAGCHVTLVTHRRLMALLSTLDARIDLRPQDVPGRVHGVDAWLPLLSIPDAIGLRPSGFAPRIPYLAASEDRVATWRARRPNAALAVGICWQGNASAPVDQGRSCDLAALAPLAAVDGVDLVSLQVGDARNAAASVAFASRIHQPGPEFDAGPDAFLDTAALMMSLDLIITVDTAVAHLAGALGRPVWIALKSPEADWRWLRRSTDTPWYPTARLYRQPRPGDWWSVFCAMARDLRELALTASDAAEAPVRLVAARPVA